jgi:hypothetical protein
LKKNNVLYRAIGSETIEVVVSIMYVIYKLTLTPFNIITVGDSDETVKSSEINAVNIFMTTRKNMIIHNTVKTSKQ